MVRICVFVWVVHVAMVTRARQATHEDLLVLWLQMHLGCEVRVARRCAARSS